MSRTIKSKKNKTEQLGIDTNSIQYLKYKDMALEFIKQGYSNIRAIYKKHYPDASDDSVDSLAYVLLDNIRFQAALEDAWREIKIDDLDIARDVVRVLQKEMFTAKNSADRISAASWLGKSKGMFIDKQEISEVNKDDNQFSLERLSRIKQADNQ